MLIQLWYLVRHLYLQENLFWSTGSPQQVPPGVQSERWGTSTWQDRETRGGHQNQQGIAMEEERTEPVRAQGLSSTEQGPSGQLESLGTMGRGGREGTQCQGANSLACQAELGISVV